MTPKLEQDFAAWVDRCDPDALGRVFDATAGRLLLLATQIAPVCATAEDLVQSTLLAAMQRASTWDRTRPVWPWLAAILQNEARMEWRRHRSRREVQSEADGVESRDPARTVASDEEFATILAAIDSLPAADRIVLRLRLVHGLAHIEIARTLEVPIGTVRARVHRGLAKLRNTLPAGAATAIAAMLASEGALLANARARLSDEAARIAARNGVPIRGAATDSYLGGLSIMSSKKLGLIAAATALALFVGYASWAPFSDRTPDDVASPPTTHTTSPTRAQSSPAEATAAATSSPARTNVDSISAWSLVGHVRTPAGEPIAGASVEVAVAPQRQSSDDWVEVSEWAIPRSLRQLFATTESDADGSFRVDLDELRAASSEQRATSLLWVTAS